MYALDGIDSTAKDVTVRIPARARKGWQKRAPWAVSLGDFSAEASTATAAAQALGERIVRIIDRASEQPIVVMLAGYVSVAIATEDGWIVRTYAPDGQQSGYSGTGDDSPLACEASMRMELAQRVTDWQSDESVRAGAMFCLETDGRDRPRATRAEFLSYAAWQRAAAHAIANGIDDYHRWASEHAGDFTITL
jgi:hypothetical protein